MIPYIIRSGDFLLSLAHRLGFNADDVWHDPENERLRALRGDPNILSPGDVLFVPEQPARKWTALTVGKHHRFVAKTTPTVRIAVIFEQAGKPLSHASCVIHGIGSSIIRKTDSSGRLSFDALVTVDFADVEFTDLGFHKRLKIGYLDPLTETSGIRQRLQNLGYLKEGQLGEADFSSALARYQRDRSLVVTSEADAQLVKYLGDEHGC